MGWAAESDRFEEDLWVRETSVIAGAPPTTLALRPGRVDPLRADNWLVLEDGRPVEVLRVEAVSGGDAEPWEVWVWNDPRLLGKGSPGAVAEALSLAAPSLARLGSVVQAPAPGGAPAAARPTLPEVAAALDRLLLDAAERPTPRAGLLVLPAAPLRLSTSAWNALAHRDARLAAEQERVLVRSLLDAAEGLAAMGWIPIVLSPGNEAEGGGAVGDHRGAAGENWKPPSGGSAGGSGMPFPVIRSGGNARAEDRLLRSLATALSTELLPWRRFAALTEGLVVRDGAGLANAAGLLAARFRIWYRTAHPPDGEDGRLEVCWLHNGAAMLENFPRRRGIPEAVARARVRYLARYGVDRLGPLEVSATALAAPDEPARIALEVSLAAAPTQLSPPPPAWLRLSCVAQVALPGLAPGRREATAAWAWAARRLAERPRGGGRFTTELRCAGDPGLGWIALVEDLETGLWGVVAPLSSRSPGPNGS